MTKDSLMTHIVIGHVKIACVLLLANAEKIWGGGKQIWATCVFPWTQGMGGMLRGPVCHVLLPSGDFSCSNISKPTSRINLCTLMRCVWLTYEWRLTLSFSPIYNWRTSVFICIQEVWCRGVAYRCKFRKGQFPGSHKHDRSLPLPLVSGCTLSELSNHFTSTCLDYLTRV